MASYLVIDWKGADQNFNFTSRRLVAEQARGYHSGIVEHEDIIVPQYVRKLAELPVSDKATVSVQMQQTAIAAVLQRILGDQVRR